MTDSQKFCRSAIAYLKAALPERESKSSPLPDDQLPVLRRLENGLLVSYVVDTGNSLAYVQNKHLSESGLTIDELHLAGCKNLSTLAVDRLRVVPYGAIHAVVLDGNFEASLILVNDIWSGRLSHLAPNGFIAALPARDILAFSDASSATGVAELRNVVARVENGDHLLTNSLYRRDDREWIQI